MTFWINTALCILSILLWGGLIVVYNKGRLFPWIANRFTREQSPGKGEGDLIAGPDFWPFNKETLQKGEGANIPLAPDVSALYEDTHYVLRCHVTEEATDGRRQGGSASDHLAAKFIIISFHDLGNEEYFTGAFPGIDIARTLGLNWISILPKTESWYRLGEYTKALNAAIEWIKIQQERFPEAKIINYGASMGGYAALKYARLLQCDAVLTLAPQWSIDPEEIATVATQHKSRFSSFFHPDMAQEEKNGRMGITEEDIMGQLYLISDPDDRHERKESALLARQIPITTLPWCFGGNELIKQLQNAEYFRLFLHNCTDPAGLSLATSAYRKTNQENILQIVFTTMTRQRPALTARALHSRRFKESGTLDELVTSRPDLARRIATFLVNAEHGDNVMTLLQIQPQE